MKSLLLGSSGYFGSKLKSLLDENHWDFATRENWESFIPNQYDIVLNAACSAARFKSNNDPIYSFKEHVEKTHIFLTTFKYKKFVQLSSLSARTDKGFYGLSKRAGEVLVDDGENLIIRVTSCYDKSLAKGVIYDILQNNLIYVSEKSSYSFAPLYWICEQIVNNLETKTGIWEIGGEQNISLKKLCKELGIEREFRSDYIDKQEIDIKHWCDLPKDAPGIEELLEFMKERME